MKWWSYRRRFWSMLLRPSSVERYYFPLFILWSDWHFAPSNHKHYSTDNKTFFNSQIFVTIHITHVRLSLVPGDSSPTNNLLHTLSGYWFWCFPARCHSHYCAYSPTAAFFALCVCVCVCVCVCGCGCGCVCVCGLQSLPPVLVLTIPCATDSMLKGTRGGNILCIWQNVIGDTRWQCPVQLIGCLRGHKVTIPCATDRMLKGTWGDNTLCKWRMLKGTQGANTLCN